MMNRLDRSERLSALIEALSHGLAARRGLPIIAAIALTAFSLLVHLVAALSGNTLVSICGFVLLHVAILAGFLGVLLAEPLGRE